MDRVGLIIEIFNAHAETKEAKLQVFVCLDIGLYVTMSNICGGGDMGYAGLRWTHCIYKMAWHWYLFKYFTLSVTLHSQSWQLSCT